MAALEEALGASEKKEKELQLRIADLGQRLNLALAQRAQELSGYRWSFSAGCGRFLAIVRTSGWSAIGLCSNPSSFSTAAPQCCGGGSRRTRPARDRATRPRYANSRGD